MTIEAFDRVHLDGTGIDRITEDEVVAVVRDALANGRGGRIITPNVDILRRASADPEVRRHLNDADLIVADGMPLVWASRLGGAPLPERVAGSSLIWSLSAGLGRDGRSIFVAGGAPLPQPPTGRRVAADGRVAVAEALADVDRAAADLVDPAAVGRVPGGVGGVGLVPGGVGGADLVPGGVGGADLVPGGVGGAGQLPDGAGGEEAVQGRAADGATRAAARLVAACPGLRIAGAFSPAYGFEEDEAVYAEFCAKVVDARPDLVFVGLGFPKQEFVIERLRRDLPATWFVGCGAAVNFVAGDVHRAPRWMQRTGLEWAHRLGTEPRRLAGRYLRHDAPYALRLLARAPRRRRP